MYFQKKCVIIQKENVFTTMAEQFKKKEIWKEERHKRKTSTNVHLQMTVVSAEEAKSGACCPKVWFECNGPETDRECDGGKNWTSDDSA